MQEDNSGRIHQSVTTELRVNQVFALLWVVVGIVVLIQSWDLKYMAEYGPGPGFLPLWLGFSFILIGFLVFAQITLSNKEKDKEVLSLPSKRAAWQMFLVMLAFFGFVFLAERLGFLLCLGLLFFFLLVVVERKGLKFSLALSIINTLIFWAIFELGLQLRLPSGLLDLLR